MHRTIKYLTVLALVLLAVALVTGYQYATRQSVIVPHIRTDIPESAPLVSTQTFPFESGTATISVPVDASVYYGAKNTSKWVSIYGNVSESTWVSDSFRAMVEDPAQDQLFNDLTAQFRNIKDQQGLSDDEYLELMAAYTQSFPYVFTGSPAKYPVETVVDRTGDCADKSLLLAGLLSHEGYKVALLVFSPESHMALGVGSTDFLYRGTGYAYLETTNLSFVGIPPDELDNPTVGDMTLQSYPLIIPIGNGTKLYSSGAETRYIEDADNRSQQNAKLLTDKITPLQPGLTAEQDQIAELEARMQQLRSAGNIAGYNSQVSEYNALVAGYNVQITSYQQLVAQYDQYAALHNYIISHAYDRPGVYAYVTAHLPS
jgi:hypothetical protein